MKETQELVYYGAVFAERALSVFRTVVLYQSGEKHPVNPEAILLEEIVGIRPA